MSKTRQPAKSAETARKTSPTSRIEITVDGVRVELSPELEAAVRQASKTMSQPLPSEMTTTRAAEFLDVSRPFVIKLVKRGELPCRLVGTHRRIPSAALVAYRETMFQRAKNAADEMAQTSQDLGLYETKVPRRKAE